MSANEVFVERTLIVPVERVFHALTDVDRLAEWFAPHPDMDGELVITFAKGGPWRLHVPGEFTLDGVVVDLRDNELIELTWHAQSVTPRWDGLEQPSGEGIEPSVVRIELEEWEAGTRLRLHHTGLQGADLDEVSSLWDRMLGRLASVL